MFPSDLPLDIALFTLLVASCIVWHIHHAAALRQHAILIERNHAAQLMLFRTHWTSDLLRLEARIESLIDALRTPPPATAPTTPAPNPTPEPTPADLPPHFSDVGSDRLLEAAAPVDTRPISPTNVDVDFTWAPIAGPSWGSMPASPASPMPRSRDHQLWDDAELHTTLTQQLADTIIARFSNAHDAWGAIGSSLLLRSNAGPGRISVSFNFEHHGHRIVYENTTSLSRSAFRNWLEHRITDIFNGRFDPRGPPRLATPRRRAPGQIRPSRR